MSKKYMRDMVPLVVICLVSALLLSLIHISVTAHSDALPHERAALRIRGGSFCVKNLPLPLHFTQVRDTM